MVGQQWLFGSFYGDIIVGKNRQNMQNIAKLHTSTTDAVTLVLLERHFIGQILRQMSGECIERSYVLSICQKVLQK